MPPAAPATSASAITSSVSAKAPGTYFNPDDRPKAPSAIAWATMARIACSSSSVGGRSTLPRTARRRVPCPTIRPKLTAAGVASRRARYSPIGYGELPSGPPIAVVTPWRVRFSASGTENSPRVPWLWMSMNPGTTASPSTSRRRPAAQALRSPMAEMRSPSIPTSATTGSEPRPSYTSPPSRMTVSRQSSPGCAVAEPAATQPSSIASAIRVHMINLAVGDERSLSPVTSILRARAPERLRPVAEWAIMSGGSAS